MDQKRVLRSFVAISVVVCFTGLSLGMAAETVRLEAQPKAYTTLSNVIRATRPIPRPSSARSRSAWSTPRTRRGQASATT